MKFFIFILNLSVFLYLLYQQDSGGKTAAKLRLSETESQLAAKKTRNTVKKTNVTSSKTNEENISPVNDDYISHNRVPTNSTNQTTMKLR